MPEQVHLLLSEPELYRLDNTMRALKGQTSKLLRDSRERFWHARYYDFNVFTHAKFVEKLRYIHRNPPTATPVRSARVMSSPLTNR